MQQRLRVWLGWGVLFAVCSAGCASSTPPPATPQVEPDAPGSLLVTQEVPAVHVRAAGPTAQGTPVFQVGHDEFLLPFSISPDGQLVLVASTDGAVSVLDFATGATRATRRMWVSPSEGGLQQARFDATGTRVLLVGYGPPYSASLFMWDLLTDTLVPGHATGSRSVDSATSTDDGSLVVTASGGRVEVRDPDTLVPRRTLVLRDAGGHELIPDHVWVSPTNTRFIATNAVYLDLGRDAAGRLLRDPVASLHLFDAEGELVAELLPQPAPPPAAADDQAERRRAPVGFRGLGFRPGGGMLMTVTTHGVVQLRHPESGALLQEVALRGAGAEAAIWSREGELLLVRDAGDQPMVHLVDPNTGAVLTRLLTAAWPLESARLRDGSLVIFSEQESAAFSVTGEQRPHPLASVLELDAGSGWFARVTPRGDRAVYAEQGVLHFVDLERGVEVTQRALTAGTRSVWGGLVVPGVGALMTLRDDGLLFRPTGVTPVFCAGDGAQLRGEGARLRVVGFRSECGLDDTQQPQQQEADLLDTEVVLSRSADGSTRVVQGESEVTVEDTRARRVRMRVLAADRVSSVCEGCPLQYHLSPEGGRIALDDTAAPLALFDTRTGRRLARLESPGRRASTVEWSADGGVLVVHWSPPYDAQAASDGTTPPVIVSVYDRSGRPLASLEGNPEDTTGGFGAAISPTHVAIFIGSRGSVLDLRRRRVSTLTVPGEATAAEWHGTTLRLAVASDDETLHLLYAPGATAAHFQLEGAGTFTSDARWVFRCRAGELERLRVADMDRTSFGACIDSSLFPSADGRFVALPQGDHLRVVREDGVAIRLATLPNGALAYVVEEATGRFTTLGGSANDVRYLYRQPGPATSAVLVPLSEAAGQADDQLLQRFVGF